MGAKLSKEEKTSSPKLATSILTEARRLIARGRESYPLPEPKTMIHQQTRAYPLLKKAEEELAKKNPDWETLQNVCEQLAGVLDSPAMVNVYEMLTEVDVVERK